MEKTEEIIESALKVLESTNPVVAGSAVTAFYLRGVIVEVVKKITYPSAEAVGGLFGKIIQHSTFQSQYSRDAVKKLGERSCKSQRN